MRTFKIYSPLMIAKYVSSFFKGQFEVAEQGIFVFDGGKVLIDENSSEIQRKVLGNSSPPTCSSQRLS